METLIVVWPNGINYEIHVETTAQIREIHSWNVYDPVKKIQPGDVVVDAGACVGVFTFKAIMDGAKTVVAFEPDEENFEILNKNMKRNPTKKGDVHLLRLGLFRASGKLDFWRGLTPGSSSILKHAEQEKIPGGKVSIQVRKLDQVLNKLEIKHIDFIKLDVEGAAAQALEGGMETLRRDKPVISAAVYHLKKEKEDVIDILDELDYTWKGFRFGGQPAEEVKDTWFIQGWSGS
jgi:FkbM family methyltransferase